MTDRSDRKRRSRRTTKDRVLQARIPEDLDEQLRDRAEHLGISVSTVVRNVLLHTFELVEGVVTDSAELARVVQGRGAAVAPAEPTPEIIEHQKTAVIGWQQAVLNRNGVCDHCNIILEKGTEAAVGVPVQARPVLLCTRCLENLGTSATQFTPPQSKKQAKKAISAGHNTSESS